MMGTNAFCRFANDYSTLIDVMRERAEQMEIARLELDRLARLADGLAGKLLSKRPVKHFGMRTLGSVLDVLGLIIVVVENPVARDKTLAMRTPFDAANRRVGNKNNSRKSEALPAPQIKAAPAEFAPPKKAEPISRAHLRVVQSRSRR